MTLQIAIKNEISVVPYSNEYRSVWNDWVNSSKNGTFLFNRNFMEYHVDRFIDNSLLFFEDNNLAGVLPATISEDTLISHGGLTYGGFVLGRKSRGDFPLRALEVTLQFCQSLGIRQIIYKTIPAIYHEFPAEEDLYALFRFSAELVRRDLSSSIRMDSRLPFSKGRKYALSLAKKAGIVVCQDHDFEEFFELEANVLARHNTRPVHTASEMSGLANNFPNNIQLLTARSSDGKLFAGVLLFITKCVTHAQYMGCSDEGREIGALDAVINQAIKNTTDKRYFDFGISTDQNGQYLNEGLLAQKEMFGARSIIYDQYQLKV